MRSLRRRLAASRVAGWWDRLLVGYWLVPLICVTVSVGAAIGLILVDRIARDRGAFWTYAGGPQNTSDTLTTIASSMVTLTALVFSITIVALQLTSSQFSPRALRNFLQDRLSQFALGIFVGTFAYALTALTAVRYSAQDTQSFVPALTLTGAYVLVAASVVVFVQFIHRTAQSVRAVNIIERIADETRAAIERLFPVDDDAPAGAPRPAGPSAEILVPRAGVIIGVDLPALARTAADLGGWLEILHPVGSYVCGGAPLARLHGGRPDDLDDARPQRFVLIGTERTMRQDVGFGLRQLVDIAERALSPGTNDPTTAVQCLHRIHDLLRQLASRRMPARRVHVTDGEVRVSVPSPTYPEMVRLAFAEIAYWGRDSIQIHETLPRILDELLTVVHDPAGRAALLEQRAELEAASIGSPSRVARS